MLDDIQDNLMENAKNVVDDNGQMGQRVKKYQRIPFSFIDNFCRITPIPTIIGNYFRTFIIFVLIGLIQYNIYYDTTNLKDLLHSLSIQITSLSLYLVNFFINNNVEKLNDILDFLGILNYMPPLKFEDLDVGVIPYSFIIYMISILIYIGLNLLSNIYTLYIQKMLLASSLTHLFVPKIFFYYFYKREENHFIYVKLLKNQVNKNLYKSVSPLILSNIFKLDHIEDISKIEIVLTPKKFLYFYDYIELSYKLENGDNSKTLKKEEPKKEKVKVKVKKDNKIDKKIEDINEKFDEIKEKMENSNISELELLDLEGLENMDI